MEKRYVILELDDAKALALNASAGSDERLSRIVDRIGVETGADIEDIAAQLKGLDFCEACVIEGRQPYCQCLTAQKLGRRLSRLVDRASGEPSFEEFAEQAPVRTVESVLGHAQPEDAYAAAYRAAVRRCQIEAAQDIKTAVAHALSDQVTRAVGAPLLYEMNQRIATEINAWRARHSDVREFQSADYSATAEEGPQQGEITIVWSGAFQALSQGHGRVRMNPLPKYSGN